MSGDALCAKLIPPGKEDSSISSPLSADTHAVAFQTEASEECSDSATPHNKFHTNIRILVITTVLFAAFIIAELVGAIIGNSLSLLGDAAATSVDVFAYSCNIYAEWKKSKGVALTWTNRLMTEVVIPSFSLLALLCVTAYIASQSISVISAPAERQRNVNVAFLFGFTAANFAIDVLSSYLFCFKGGREVFTHHQHHNDGNSSNKTTNCSDVKNDDFGSVKEPDSSQAVVTSGLHDVEAQLPQLGGNQCTIAESSTPSITPTIAVSPEQPQQIEYTSPPTATISTETATIVTKRSNINMISAVTHLGGDSLRTVAVFVAAMFAALTGARADLCDAWAAIIVSFTIVILAVPLIVEIRKAFSKLLQERE